MFVDFTESYSTIYMYVLYNNNTKFYFIYSIKIYSNNYKIIKLIFKINENNDFIILCNIWNI